MVEVDEFKQEWPLEEESNINLAKAIIRKAAAAGQLVDKEGWLKVDQLVTMLQGAIKKKITKSDVTGMAAHHPEIFETS
jgi:hypothetical protein